MARILSVNVGLPRDVDWHGKVVHTAIWKRPVSGACRVRRLNLDGDGQGDLRGHRHLMAGRARGQANSSGSGPALSAGSPKVGRSTPKARAAAVQTSFGVRPG
jgi:hypothetical protein